ncbi:hypothetical protein [Demequina sp.]|uniref:hypothetical protein n=1 Tax=Demequina sp. TaxID=2050685 RepID=UPI003A8B4EF4
MTDAISARITDIHDELANLLRHLNEFPSLEAIKHTEGANASVAAPFNISLKAATIEASRITKELMTAIASMDDGVRAALNDLVEQDASLAAAAARVESFLDDIATEPGATQQPATTTVSQQSTSGGSSFSNYSGQVKDA